MNDIELRELARKLRETLDTRLLYEPDFLIECYNKILVKRFVAMKKNKREFDDKT